MMATEGIASRSEDDMCARVGQHVADALRGGMQELRIKYEGDISALRQDLEARNDELRDKYEEKTSALRR